MIYLIISILLYCLWLVGTCQTPGITNLPVFPPISLTVILILPTDIINRLEIFQEYFHFTVVDALYHGVAGMMPVWWLVRVTTPQHYQCNYWLWTEWSWSEGQNICYRSFSLQLQNAFFLFYSPFKGIFAISFIFRSIFYGIEIYDDVLTRHQRSDDFFLFIEWI